MSFNLICLEVAVVLFLKGTDTIIKLFLHDTD